MELPIEAPADGLVWQPKEPTGRILVTGAAGTVATLIAPHLAETHELIGLDTQPIDHPAFTVTHRVDLGNTQVLTELIRSADYVLHLATGVAQGGAGLAAVDVAATSRILALAIRHGTHRVILASSNHVAGWAERELIAGHGTGQVKPWDPPRPDGAYGAAKAHMEALGRFASDSSGLPVSILRIGTMRANMTLQELIDSTELAYLGFGEFRRHRLTRTWLRGGDLVAIVREEFAASEPFRLRYTTSSPGQQEWDHTVFTG